MGKCETTWSAERRLSLAVVIPHYSFEKTLKSNITAHMIFHSYSFVEKINITITYVFI